MKRRNLRVLWRIFRNTGADKIIGTFVIIFFIAALAIFLIDPAVRSYLDSLWYCFAAITTIGFGDVAVSTIGARIITVVLSIYAIVVIAIVTAVVTNFFIELARARASADTHRFIDDLEHLPDLSREELEELSRKVREFNRKK